MDLQYAQAPAELAAPSIPLQHLLAQPPVGFPVQLQTWAPGVRSGHDAFRTRSRNCLRCGWGRKSTRRARERNRAFPLLLSGLRLAPARKSAQIISRQYPRDLSLPSISAAVSRACSITGSWLLYSLK